MLVFLLLDGAEIECKCLHHQTAVCSLAFIKPEDSKPFAQMGLDVDLTLDDYHRSLLLWLYADDGTHVLRSTPGGDPTD